MKDLDLRVLSQFGCLELIAKQMVEGFITGLHQSPFHGFSVEFAEYRPYNSGESTRNIDWKLYGRTDKLFVKQFEEETNLRCQILIDISSSMRFPKRRKYSLENPNKLYFSVYAAAAFIQILRRQRDAVGLTLFDDEIKFHTRPKSSLAHVKMLYNEMEKLLASYTEKDCRGTQIIRTLHEVAERIHRRSLVILFSDMFDFRKDNDELFLALQHLRYSKHEVIVFEVTDKSLEVDFDLENRPYRLVDMESEEDIKINAAEIKEYYKNSIKKFRDELKVRCGQYKIDLVEVDINEGFNKVLMTYFLKRKRMG